MHFVQQPLSVELTPIVRLRSTRATGADGFRSDLSFVFVWGSEVTMPTSLLPPQMASSPSTSSGRSDLLSPPSSHRQQNFKDVLVFDASGGVLSLRRITLEQRPRELGIPFSSPIASLATSISLPGVGAAGRLSASPPVQARTSGREAAKKGSGLTQQMLEAVNELVGKESTVATWQLKRRHDWGEVKHVLHEVGDQLKPTSSKFVSPLFLVFVLSMMLIVNMDTQLARTCRTLNVRALTESGTPLDLSLAPILVLYPRRGLSCTRSTAPAGHPWHQDRRAERSRGECVYRVRRRALRRGHGFPIGSPTRPFPLPLWHRTRWVVV